jgi:hypothetical protein
MKYKLQCAPRFIREMPISIVMYDRQELNHLDPPFDNLAVLVNWSRTAQKDETRNFGRMGEYVGELGVLRSVDFFNTGHGGESARY